LDFLNSSTIEYLKSDGQWEGNIQILIVIDFADFNVPLQLCCNHGENRRITYVINRKPLLIYFSNPGSDKVRNTNVILAQ